MVAAVRRLAVLVEPERPRLVVDALVEDVEGIRPAPTYDAGVARPGRLDPERAADRSAAADRLTAVAICGCACR